MLTIHARTGGKVTFRPHLSALAIPDAQEEQAATTAADSSINRKEALQQQRWIQPGKLV